MMTSIQSQIEQNKTRTWLIMAFFAVFIATVAFILGKTSGYGISWAATALFISSFMSLGSYFWGDKLILAMSKARPADKANDADYIGIVQHVSAMAKIPMPKAYIMEEEALNAFATGRDPQHASVCVTRGIINKLNRNELEGVLAHEISHIRNFDIRVLAVVTILVGMAAFLSDWFLRTLWFGGGRRDRDERGNLGSIFFLAGVVFAVLSPVIATIIQLAISRRREFLADASGALLTRNPAFLASALEKISSDKAPLRVASNSTAHLFIINPLKGKNLGQWFSGLFNTHPPAQERIRILRSM